MPLTGAMTFPDDGCTIGLNGNAHPGDIDSEEDSAVLSG